MFRSAHAQHPFSANSWKFPLLWKASSLPVRLLLLAMILASSFTAASAQEFRATISGTIADSTGAVVPGAEVTLREVSTGTVVKAVSDSAGQYTAPFLQPGEYVVTVEKEGFSKIVRNAVTAQSGGHPVIDIALVIGDTGTVVNVTADTPLVNQANDSIGQVISTEQIANMPLNGRTPMMLTQLSMGVVATGYPSQVRAFDNDAAANWSIAGSPSHVSEILLDGAPDTIWSGALAYSPMQDAVQEVSVHAFDSDAAYGHSVGGVINQILKPGTNTLHGTLYYFGQISNLGANNYFNKRTSPVTARPVTHYNQYGGTVGGPIRIPHLYNGRDKLFFFFGYEGLKDSQPTNFVTTVPTLAERSGDFSALLSAGCSGAYSTPDKSVCATGKPNPYQLYNPYSATQSGSVITRQPIQNNRFSDAGLAINAIAANYLKYFPAPNTTGNASGQFNYTTNPPSVDNYDNELGRIDWNMSSRSHFFFDFRHNYRTQVQKDYLHNGSTATTLTRENWGGSLDEVYTLSPTTVLDVRLNFTEFIQAHGASTNGIQPSSVGFPTSLDTASVFPQLPYLLFGSSSNCSNFNSFQCLGSNTSTKDPTTQYQLYGSVVKTLARQTLKFGIDARQLRLNVANYGDSSGAFTFGSDFVQQASNTIAPTFGGDFASFLLGLPSSGDYVQATRADYHTNYIAGFLQDDIRFSPQFTLNAGLRFDRDTPYTEARGRVVNGFDPNIASPVAAAAQTAYGANPSAILPAGSFAVRGGLTYPSTGNRDPYNAQSSIVSPRIGFSYSPNRLKATVIRGGFGMFVGSILMSNPIGVSAVTDQEGFTATTNYVATNNNFLTPATTLSSPFPNGFTPASGSSLGAGQDMGKSTVYFLAPNQHDPYSERWNLGVQQSLSSNLLLEVAYIGNHGVHLPVSYTQFNPLPSQYLSTSPIRDTAVINQLSASAKNPFAGLLPNTPLNAANVNNSQIVAAHPQFVVGNPNSPFTSGVIEQNASIGQSYFQSLDVRLEKRLNKGLSLIGNYSFSKLIDANSYLNESDTSLTRQVSANDHTHHFVIAGTYDLPFGKDRTFGTTSTWLNEIVGGFRVNGIYTYQTGAPIPFTQDIIRTTQPLTVDNRKTTGSAFAAGAFDSAAADQLSYHLRTLPASFSYIRQDGINNLDASVLKEFALPAHAGLQLRFESFNTLNRATFAAPTVTNPQNTTSFGAITKQANTPRQIQLGARITF